MPTVRCAAGRGAAAVLALPVAPGAEGAPAEVLATDAPVSGQLATECATLLAQASAPGRAGTVTELPRPLSRPRRVLLVGVGDGTERRWRAAGAALARAARRESTLTVALPSGAAPGVVRGVTEGLLLAAYRYRLGADDPEQAPQLGRVTLRAADPERYEAARAEAETVAAATRFARDLTNAPALRKSPDWFVRELAKAARPVAGLTVRHWDAQQLADEGFGGILAVGRGSARPPRLLELSWQPPDARRHVVLVGKGITFDTGGISLKPASAMKLMRKDMAGGAAVAAATVAAAQLRLPVRVTTLVPLAENMPGAAAQRPGDVIRQWDGTHTEVHNTDAEGRLVLADALAYAAARLAPDQLVDLATLTGANAVALGNRTGALYSEDDALAAALSRAAEDAGEQVWRLPLVTDYAEAMRSAVADRVNAVAGGAGSVLAALFLREFTGAARGRWAHIDMSAPSWSDRDDGDLVRGATGWGVRTLLRWLATDTREETVADTGDAAAESG